MTLRGTTGPPELVVALAEALRGTTEPRSYCCMGAGTMFKSGGGGCYSDFELIFFMQLHRANVKFQPKLGVLISLSPPPPVPTPIVGIVGSRRDAPGNHRVPGAVVSSCSDAPRDNRAPGASGGSRRGASGDYRAHEAIVESRRDAPRNHRVPGAIVGSRRDAPRDYRTPEAMGASSRDAPRGPRAPELVVAPAMTPRETTEHTGRKLAPAMTLRARM